MQQEHLLVWCRTEGSAEDVQTLSVPPETAERIKAQHKDHPKELCNLETLPILKAS